MNTNPASSLPVRSGRRPFTPVLLCCGLLLLTLCDRPVVPPTVVQIDPVQQKYQDWLAREKNAIPELREILEDERIADFRLRTHALLAAGRIGASELAPQMMRLLKDDPHPAVKNCAVIALVDLQHTAALPLMLSFLPGGKRAEDSIDRTILLEHLGRMGDERAIPALIDALGSEGVQERLKAQNALVELKSTAAIEPLLELHARDREGRFDKEVAVVLGAIQHPRSGPALLRLVRRPESRGRIAAVNGVGALEYAPAESALLNILRLQRSREADLLTRQTGRALAALNLAGSVAPLIALFDAPSLSLRLVAAETLSEMTVPGIAGKALGRLKGRDRAVVIPAAFVLGMKKHAPASELLRSLYQKYDGPEAFYTAQALGRIGDRESIPLFLEALHKRVGEPAYGAAFALGAMKAKEAVEPMIAVLASNTRDLSLKKHCVAALGEIGDPRAAAAIIALPLAEKIEMGDLAGRALGKLGGPEVFAFLEGSIRSEDVNERRVARLTLIHFHDPDRVDFFLGLLQDQDPKTRRAAMTALRKNTGKNLGTEQEWVDWADAR